jgi:hypothetical protein
MHTFTCPDCEADVSVPDYLAGKTVLCRSCKTIIPVPYENLPVGKLHSRRVKAQSQPRPYASGSTLIFIGAVIQFIGLLVLSAEPILGGAIITAGSWFLLAGIIRWAVAPVIAQNEQVFRELQKVKGEQND